MNQIWKGRNQGWIHALLQLLPTELQRLKKLTNFVISEMKSF